MTLFDDIPIGPRPRRSQGASAAFRGSKLEKDVLREWVEECGISSYKGWLPKSKIHLSQCAIERYMQQNREEPTLFVQPRFESAIDRFRSDSEQLSKLDFVFIRHHYRMNQECKSQDEPGSKDCVVDYIVHNQIPAVAGDWLIILDGAQFSLDRKKVKYLIHHAAQSSNNFRTIRVEQRANAFRIIRHVSEGGTLLSAKKYWGHY